MGDADLGHLLGIEAFRGIGVVRIDPDEARQIVGEPTLLPFFHREDFFEGRQFPFLDLDAVAGFREPVHVDVFRPRLIAFVHDHGNEGLLVDVGLDHDGLPFLEGDSAAHDELSVFFHQSFLHCFFTSPNQKYLY